MPVAIDGERIASVDGSSPNGSTRGDVVDVDGLTLLPGLIDAHTHFGMVAVTEAYDSPAVTAARIFRNCELALDGGFTTVRDVGGIDGGVARAVALGLVPGPSILPSDRSCARPAATATCPTRGPTTHTTTRPGLMQLARPCDGPDEVRLAARDALRRGATQLKVCVSGGVLSFTDRIEDAQFSVDELKAAVAEADARGTYVTAHAHNVDGIRNGLAAGVECFEHGTFLDEATAEAMAKAGAYLVPTFAVTRLLAEKAKDWGIPDDLLPRMEGIEDAMANSLKLARAAGLVIGSGSDLLGPEQNRRGLEITIRAELEDPMEAIVAATATNARVLRRADDIGTVEPGKRADVIAVDGNPLTDAKLFDDPSRVILVVKDGQVVKDIR